MPDLYPFARRLLFAMDAESAHHLTLSMMRMADALGLLGALTGPGDGPAPSESAPIELMGLRFPNRVGLAAGLDKSGSAVHAFGELGFDSLTAVTTDKNWKDIFADQSVTQLFKVLTLNAFCVQRRRANG